MHKQARCTLQVKCDKLTLCVRYIGIENRFGHKFRKIVYATRALRYLVPTLVFLGTSLPLKINKNDIIFYLDINFYFHVLVFKLNICFLIV